MLKSLRASDQKFNEGITFMLVDWDTYRSHAVTKSRRIPRRSTLVLIKGGKEVGRLVAATGKGTIKKLLEKGL